MYQSDMKILPIFWENGPYFQQNGIQLNFLILGQRPEGPLAGGGVGGLTKKLHFFILN